LSPNFKFRLNVVHKFCLFWSSIKYSRELFVKFAQNKNIWPKSKIFKFWSNINIRVKKNRKCWSKSFQIFFRVIEEKLWKSKCPKVNFQSQYFSKSKIFKIKISRNYQFNRFRKLPKITRILKIMFFSKQNISAENPDFWINAKIFGKNKKIRKQRISFK